MQANILAIELSSKVWHPKVLNNYIHMDYSNDIDEGVFEYSYCGKAVFQPNLQWADRPRSDLINFNETYNTVEL